MTLRTWYKIHKWLWIFTGIFLLGWLISGILMLVPQRLLASNPQVPPKQVNYDQVTIAPAQAIAIARHAADSEAPAARVVFRPVHDVPLYGVKLAGAPEISINAVSGELFYMSPEFAKIIVAFNFPQAGRPLTVTKLNQHSLMYPFGQLPVFQLKSKTSPSTSYFVNAVDGGVFRSTSFTRIRGALLSLHDFSVLNVVTDNERLRKSLLLMASTVALVGALIGYYLALPHRRRD